MKCQSSKIGQSFACEKDTLLQIWSHMNVVSLKIGRYILMSMDFEENRLLLVYHDTW